MPWSYHAALFFKLNFNGLKFNIGLEVKMNNVCQTLNLIEDLTVHNNQVSLESST